MKKKLALGLGTATLLTLIALLGCGDEGSTGPSGVKSCDVKMEMTLLGQTISMHTCVEGAAATQAECDSSKVAAEAFGGTAVFGKGCPAGHSLKCQEGDFTIYHYDTEAGETCETMKADDDQD